MFFKRVVSPAGKGPRIGLSVKVKQVESAVILECTGRIRYRKEAELFAAKAREILDGRTNLIIDLGGVEAIDGAALSELVIVHMRARAAECEVRLGCVNDLIRSVLELTNIASLFETYPTLNEAVASLSKAGVNA
jgi:anti-sigma B factor antagonist